MLTTSGTHQVPNWFTAEPRRQVGAPTGCCETAATSARILQLVADSKLKIASHFLNFSRPYSVSPGVRATI